MGKISDMYILFIERLAVVNPYTFLEVKDAFDSFYERMHDLEDKDLRIQFTRAMSLARILNIPIENVMELYFEEN